MALYSKIQQGRLEFMTDFMSRRAIARQANISYYRLSKLATEGIALSGAEATRMRNLSRKLSYQDLRLSGFSASQARRFRGASVENLGNVKRRFKRIQDRLTEGVYTSMKAEMERKGAIYDDQILKEKAREALIKGLAKSKKTIEDWENY